MSFLVLLCALMLAYYRPLPKALALGEWHGPLSLMLEHKLNDGKSFHGIIGWSLGVALPVLAVGAGYLALRHYSSLLAAFFGILLLYLLLDLRGFSTPAEEISASLHNGELAQARQRLTDWGRPSPETFGLPEISRLSIETTLLRAHYGLFAPMFWFVLLGPAGTLLYCLSKSTHEVWKGDLSDFSNFAHRVFHWLDWLPVRFTAISFAVVGDFEDAVYCWRIQSTTWPSEAEGIMLSSGAGAMGVRLGDPLPKQDTVEFRPALGIGDEADAEYVMSAVGLTWRVLVLMLALLFLMTFAKWLGN